VAASVAVAFSLVLVAAFSATNAVPATNAGGTTRAIDADALKPGECASISVAVVRMGAGVYTGTSARELILGSAGLDVIDGGGGNDCLVGGAEDDSLRGGNGTDVCIGGPGVDTFYSSCETQIQ
jgi:Ca2+-binding RTX toxin-like protein